MADWTITNKMKNIIDKISVSSVQSVAKEKTPNLQMGFSWIEQTG
jgi:hypothetical protein